MQLFWKALGIVFMVVFGIAMIWIAFHGAWQTLERLSLWIRGHRARGVIVSVDQEKDPDSKPVYRLTVEFPAPDGQHRIAALPDRVYGRRRTGEHITVLYRPDDPDHVVALAPGQRILSVVAFPILLVAGVGSFALAIAYLLDLDSVRFFDHVLEFTD